MNYTIFEWSDKLSCNVKQIDQQHQQLVKQINILYESIELGEESKVVWRILGNLVEYANIHFRTEEFLMAKSNYDNLALHKNTHKMFSIDLKEMIDQYVAGDKDVGGKLAKYLTVWLENHIMKDDKQFSAHLNKAGFF